jgi:hypothetical protein
MTKTNAFLTAIGEMIVTAAIEDPGLTFENIREMHTTVEGAETLRLIVRDDLGGAADVITAALMG